MAKAASQQPSATIVEQSTDQTGDETGVSRDEAFEVLSNRRRRYTLHYLVRNGETATLGDVAEQVAAWENDKAVSGITSSERKTVYTSLQQFHLPKLDEKDVVSFDERAGEIALTDRARDLDIYLEVVDRYDIPWSFYYLGATLLGITLVSLSWLGIGPFATVPADGWTVFLLGVFLVSSLSHVFISRRMRLGSDEKPPEVIETDA
ncbi:DUF7344 domain-containing protein [Halorhabdus amylolytica]|uniref:DUF7344 domain-containing protein n=1 Tax=Halorhabdus amylolytica TaxID=2559573 RepID=UPI001B7D8253|nr:hypothetical protein [Halorhabdus amylolytica]